MRITLTIIQIYSLIRLNLIMHRIAIFLEDGEYRPNRDLKSKEKIKKRLIYTFLDKNTNSNKWTLQQNEKFLRFVESNKELLECPIKRKRQKIFLQISKAIKTRSPDQCRSHHQKMIKHHGNIDGIIDHLKERIYGVESQKKQTQVLEKGTIDELKVQDGEKVVVFETSNDFQMLEENYMQENIWGVFNDDIWMYNLDSISGQQE